MVKDHDSINRSIIYKKERLMAIFLGGFAIGLILAIVRARRAR